MDDIRFTEGLLNLSEAGRYPHVPQQTFHRWARGYRRGEPLLHVLEPQRRRLPVTFIALAGGHILDALRDAAFGRRRSDRPSSDFKGVR